MLLGLLGDVHAEDWLLRRALGFFEEELVDAIACVGDVIDGSGDDDACVRLLVEHRVRCVRGNHERWYLEAALQRLQNPKRPRGLSWGTLRWAASLPATALIATPSGPAQLCHGMDQDDMALLLPKHSSAHLEAHPGVVSLRRQGIRYALCGHSHVRMVRRLGDLTIINAGTLDRRDKPGLVLVDFALLQARYYDLSESGVNLASTHPLR